MQDEQPVQDEQVVEPVQSEPAQESQPAQEEPTENQEVPKEESKEQPKEATPKTTQEVEELLSQYRTNEPYQFNNKDGYVDPNEVASAIEQRLVERMAQQRQEQRAWERIENKYPEIKEDSSLRELMLNQHIAEAVQGKKSNLEKVADGIMERVKGAKIEGRNDAKVSKKVAQAASLETTTRNSGEGKNNDLMDRIAGGDKVASEQLIRQWMEDGKI